MSSWIRTVVFHQIETYEDFRTVHVANDTIEWDCGIVLDPDYVYGRSKKSVEFEKDSQRIKKAFQYN